MCVRALALAVMFSLLSWAAGQVRADADVLEPEVLTEFQAPFRLVLNHVDKGEVLVYLKDGDVFIKREDLSAAGVSQLDGKDQVIAGQPYLSLKSVSPPLEYTLEESTIELRVEAPVALLPTTKLDLAGSPPDIVYARETAAFFNYAASVDDRGRFTLYQESAATIQGNLLFSSMYLSSERPPLRGLTNFTIDDPQNLERIVLGDSLTTTGPIGGGRFIGGFTLSRTYALNPYAIRTPHLGHVGSTATPATLDVYVNGARVYSEQIQPGTFQLDNLRVGGGRGTATYVVRDVFGREHSISNPFYISSGTLAKGLREYTYSFGMLRDNVGFESWGYRHPGALAQHRVGLTDQLTLGGRVEISDDRISGGPALDLLTPIGLFEAELGASGGLASGPGIAGFVSYSFTSRVFGAGFYARLMSARYVTLSLDHETDRVLAELGAFQSMPLSRRISGALQQSLSHARDRGTSARLSAQMSWNVASRCNALFSASHNWLGQGTTAWELYASISYSLPLGHSVSAAARMNSSGPAMIVNASKSLPLGPGYGYRSSTVLSEHSSHDGLLQYQTLYGRYGLGYHVDQNRQHLTLDAAGSLVLVPGAGLFASLPVQDGVALIRVPGVSNVRGYVNNQEIGTTDHNGNLLVPNLLSYYGNRLSIAPEDVPIQYGIEKTELTLAPPYRGLAVANFHATLTRYVRGRVVVFVDPAGRRVVPAYGELHVQRAHDEVVSPLGVQAEFELLDLAPGRHRALIDYEAGRCEFDLTVPDSEQPLIELGELTCHTSQ